MVAAVRAWAADRDSTGVRRGLQLALGLTWLLDAALQFQPFMFGKGFVTQVLAPAQAGNPHLVAAPALAVGHLIGQDVPPWNAAFATIQLALAVGLLWRPTVKAALAASAAWSLSVWWLGEGLGGVLTGSATAVTGAPGAVILYGFLAVLVWPARPGSRTRGRATAGVPAGDDTGSRGSRSPRPGGSVADGSPLGARWARLGWLVLWGSLAYLAVQPANRAPGMLHDAVAGLATGEPGWLAEVDRGVAAAVGTQGMVVAIVISALAAVIACAVFVPAATRPALMLAVLLAVAIWVAGEDFGGVLTGQGTDPNTGPLLVMLAVAFWPRYALRRHPARRNDTQREAAQHDTGWHAARQDAARDGAHRHTGRRIAANHARR